MSTELYIKEPENWIYSLVGYHTNGKFKNGVFHSTKFDGCKIEDSDISRCRSEAIKMHAFIIDRSSIVNSSIEWSSVCGVSLANTNIYKCYVEGLAGTDLRFEENMQVSNSNFTNLHLVYSAFADTEMMGKKNRLSNAYFVDTFFNDVNFAEAAFKNVSFVHSPVFLVDIHGVDDKEVLVINKPVDYNTLIGDNAGKSKVRAKLRLKLPGAAYNVNGEVWIDFNKDAIHIYDADNFDTFFINWVKNYAGSLGVKGVTAWIDILEE